MLTKKGKLDNRLRRICFQAFAYEHEQLYDFVDQYRNHKQPAYEYCGKKFRNYYIISSCEDEIEVWSTRKAALILDFGSEKNAERFTDYLFTRKRGDRIDEILQDLKDNPL